MMAERAPQFEPKEGEQAPPVPVEQWNQEGADALKEPDPADLPPDSMHPPVGGVQESGEVTRVEGKRGPVPVPEIEKTAASGKSGVADAYEMAKSGVVKKQLSEKAEQFRQKREADRSRIEQLYMAQDGDVDKTIDAIITNAAGPEDLFLFSEEWSHEISEEQQKKITKGAVKLMHRQFPSTGPEGAPTVPMQAKAAPPQPKPGNWFTKLFRKE